MIPADAKLIPGHGKVSTIDDLRDYNQMILETTLIIRKAMKEGKTLDQIKTAGSAGKIQRSRFRLYQNRCLDRNHLQKLFGKYVGNEEVIFNRYKEP